MNGVMNYECCQLRPCRYRRCPPDASERLHIMSDLFFCGSPMTTTDALRSLAQGDGFLLEGTLLSGHPGFVILVDISVAFVILAVISVQILINKSARRAANTLLWRRKCSQACAPRAAMKHLTAFQEGDL